MSDAISSWQAFWSVAAGISGTLFGLLLVVIVLSQKEAFSGSGPVIRGLAYRAMWAYSTVSVIGLLLLVPMLPPRRLGAAIAGFALILVLWTSFQIAAARSERKSSLPAFHWTQIAPWVCYVGLLWSGVKMMRGGVHAIDWLGIGAILLLIAGGTISFEIVRRVSS